MRQVIVRIWMTPLRRTMMDSPGPANPPGKRKVKSFGHASRHRRRTTVSLIPSLIHVRGPASITVYYRALSGIYEPSWSVLDGHP